MLGPKMTDFSSHLSLFAAKAGIRKTEWWRDSSRTEYRGCVKRIDEAGGWRFSCKLMWRRGYAVSKNFKDRLHSTMGRLGGGAPWSKTSRARLKLAKPD